MNLRPTVPAAMAAITVLFAFLVPAVLADEPTLATEEQKTLYALGVAVASRIPKFNPSPEDIAAIQAGIQDALAGREPRVDMSAYTANIQPLLEARVATAAEAERTAGLRFRDEVAKQQGAVTTASGLVYVEIAAGTGAQPGPTDTVKVNYTGTLRDGSVFDSSVNRGTPATFALDGVVPCFSEGLQLMKVGGKARLVCPPDLAYGDRGTPRIPPGATLSFEVELLEIAPPAGSGTGG